MTGAVIDAGQAPDTPREGPISTRDWIAVAAGILGAFMAVLDIAITNSSLPQIQGEIGATGTEGTWISTAYLVAETIMIPLSAWMVRLFGLGRFVFVCAALFTVFSVICGYAQSLPQMIFGRLGQGFFGGALIPTAMTIIALKLPPSKLALGMTLFGTTVVMAPVLGPVLGGFLTDNAGWYWVFFINIPVGLLLLTMIQFGFDTEPFNWDELRRGDWLGIGGLSLFLGTLTVVLEEGHRDQWFESAFIVKLTIACIFGLGLFLIAQKLSKDPVLKLNLLRNRNFSGSLIIALLMGGAYFSVLYVVPIFLGVIAGYNASQIGVVMMYSGAGSLVTVFAYPMLAKHVDLRLLVFAGLILAAISFHMGSFLASDWGTDQFIWLQLVLGAAMSLIFFPLSQVALAGIVSHDVPDASGFFNMARNLGGSIGLALTATLIDTRHAFHLQVLAETISANGAIAAERLAAISNGLAMRATDGVDNTQRALILIQAEIEREALTMSFADYFTVMMVAAVIVLPSILMLARAEATDGAMAH